MQYLRQLDDYFKVQVDDVVSIYAPGKRPPSIRSLRYIKAYKPFFVHCKEGHCFRIGFVNSFKRLGGFNGAEKIIHIGTSHIDSLSICVDCLTSNIGRHRGRSVRSLGVINSFTEQNSGIYVLCFLGKEGYRGRSNDHVLFVDIGAHEILDCVEHCAMSFSRESLECFVEDGFILQSVAEIRFMEQQPAGSSTSKKRNSVTTERRNMERVRKVKARKGVVISYA